MFSVLLNMIMGFFSNAPSCRNCQSYETCMAVMDGDLPDYPCAYWEKKKP